MNLYAIFGRVVQVGLQEAGVNSIRVIHLFPRYLDTVVVMRLVRHPMYLVGVSPPYKLIELFFMVRVHDAVCSRTHAYTHTCIYVFIYMFTVAVLSRFCLLKPFTCIV